MRYLGNKESIRAEIEKLLDSKQLLRQGYSFFDAFCGSGSVADYLKSYYDIIINDNLTWSVTYTRGRVCAPNCTFQRLGFDPFAYLNKNKQTMHGFMYQNYAPTKSERMYFTPENAGRIDYFRYQIEQWKQAGQLTEDEYCFLLASLIESVSDVSNTAGVYGAFLKKWDARAVKEISFHPVDFCNTPVQTIQTYNTKIETVIEQVDCDILYLDPPYNARQYCTNYHVLETIARYDAPQLKGKTGLRDYAAQKSDFCSARTVAGAFEDVIRNAEFRYIFLSYNNEGLMPFDVIRSIMQKYGSYEIFLTDYKRFKADTDENRRHKSSRTTEYLHCLLKR